MHTLMMQQIKPIYTRITSYPLGFYRYVFVMYSKLEHLCPHYFIVFKVAKNCPQEGTAMLPVAPHKGVDVSQ